MKTGQGMLNEIKALAANQRQETARYKCPRCSHTRKNHRDPCLSVTVLDDRLVYFCWHCQLSGRIPLKEDNKFQQRATMPSPIINPSMTDPPGNPLSDRTLGWLANRGIPSSLAAKFGLVEGEHFFPRENKTSKAIGFPYKNQGQTYATKWRSIESKAFSQTGAASTLWLIDYVTKGDPLVICEGEADALALHQAGITAVSIPNGAPAQVVNGKIDPKDDKKFAYLWHAKDIIDAAPKVILAVDADGPGDALAEEIARRVGRAKCWRVTWPSGVKDANDCLRCYGTATLAEVVQKAAPFPVKGLYEADTFYAKVEELYNRGLPKGVSTGFPQVDELYTVVPGQLTIATGSPGSGKSAFLDNVMVEIARNKEWKFAVCSFENPPDVHIAKLAAIYANKPFFSGPSPRMDRLARDEALTWVREHFVFLHQSDGSLSNLTDILDLGRAAVMRYGIRGIVVDPINYIGRNTDQSETDWVSDALTQMKLFASANDCHFWLVAHPQKLQRKQDGSFPMPTGYDISGSAHYFNKADMGITIHREDKTSNKSTFHCWKSRFFWSGAVGNAELIYHPPTGKYLNPNFKLGPIYSCA